MIDRLAEKISAYITDRQLTKKAFAEMLGVSPVTVSRWCGGISNPPSKMRDRIEAVISGVSPVFDTEAKSSIKSAALPSLPLTMTDFAALRQGGMIYVDKTDLVYELAKDFGFYFLNRPRRFGKSLLVSTFKSLFQHGLRDFKGLKIEKLWKEEKTYQVISISFSSLGEIHDKDAVGAKITALVGRQFKKIGFQFDKSDDSDFWTQFADWLEGQPSMSIVLLIDEYDAGLTGNIDNKEVFDAAQSVLQTFFGILKDYSGAFRFFFLTGITKYSNTGTLSPFNNLIDISLAVRFSALLGYTEEEIRDNFREHLKEAARIQKMTVPEVIKEILKHYDGYCFDKTGAKHVCCPWAVMRFLQMPANGFENYWYNSGGQPRALLNYIMTTPFRLPETFDSDLTIDEQSLYDMRPYAQQQPLVMLYQNGYLTIKSPATDGTLTLGYPNREVKESLSKLYVNAALRSDLGYTGQLESVSLALSTYDAAQIIDFLNRFFNTIDYEHFPLKDEGAVRGMVQAFIQGAGIRAISEKHSSKGRSDLEVFSTSRRIVFEFKYSRRAEEESELLNQATKQILSRQYGYDLDSRPLLRIAAVFSATERQLTKFREVPLNSENAGPIDS